MKTLSVLFLTLAFSLSACRSKEAELKQQRQDNLKKDLVALYLEASLALSQKKNQVIAKSQLAIHLAKAGEPERAQEILDQSYQAVSKMPASPEKDAQVKTVARAFLDAKIPARSLVILTDMPASKDKDDLQLALIAHYAQADEPKVATTLIKSLKSAETKELGQTLLLVEIVKAGKIDEALKKVDTLKAPKNIARVFAAAVEKHLAQKNIDAASKLLSTMQGGNVRNQARSELVLALWSAGQSELALKQLEGIESVWIRAKTRTLLSNRLYQDRKYSQAKTFGEKALDEVRTISDAVVKEAAVEDLARLFLKSKRTKEALDLGRLIQTPEGLVAVHSALVEAYALVGRFDETKKLTKSLIQQPLYGAAGLTRLAEIYADDNQFLEAIKVATQIAIMELRLPAIAQVAVMHQKSGQKLNEEVLSAFESAMKSPL